MNLWEFIERRIQAREYKRSGIKNPENWLLDGGVPAIASGVTVTEESALNTTAVFACVRVLSGAIASLPCHVMQTTADGKRRAVEHPLYWLLHDEPNPEMTSYQWREAGMVGALLWGNAYSYIELDRRAAVVSALWPMTSDRVTPKRAEGTRDVVYDVFSTDGGTVTLGASSVLHVPGLGFDGITGKSVVGLHREAVGLAVVTEKHGATYFGRGGRPPFALIHPGKGDRKAADTIRRAYADQNGTVDKLHLPFVGFDGLKFENFGMSNEDSQFLETRVYQTAEIAGRMFGVPLWMIGEHSKESSWGTGVEQQFIAFVTVTLMPWIRRWEMGMGRALLSPADRAAGYYVQLDVRGLLRGDFASRVEGYHSAISDGWMSRNEVRVLEDLDRGPDDLDEFVMAAGGSALQVNGGRAAGDFRPLLEATWRRILKRGAQDWLTALKREDAGSGGKAEWRQSMHSYAFDQLAPIEAAMGITSGSLIRHWDGLPQNPDAWDDHSTMAAELARLCIAGD